MEKPGNTPRLPEVFGGGLAPETTNTARVLQLNEGGPTHAVNEACLGRCSILGIAPEWARQAVLEGAAAVAEAGGTRIWCAGPLPGQAPGRYVCHQASGIKPTLLDTARIVNREIQSW